MTRPERKQDEMKRSERPHVDVTEFWSGSAQREFASAMNLMAHPMAAVSAATALTFGLAGHAYGLWLGTMAGAVEASQKAMFGEIEGERLPVTPVGVPHLRLVASADLAGAGAAMRTVAADAERIVQDTIEVATRLTGEVLEETVEAVDAATALLEEAGSVSEQAAEADAPRAPAAIDRPAEPDDLKAIAGIGPKLEKVLNDLGVWSYGQLEALGDAEIAWLDERLGFAGRIRRDDWTGQARALADKARG